MKKFFARIDLWIAEAQMLIWFAWIGKFKLGLWLVRFNRQSGKLVATYHGFKPAKGIELDRIGRLYGIERQNDEDDTDYRRRMFLKLKYE